MPITDLNLAKLSTSSDGLEFTLTYLRREHRPPLYRVRIRGGAVGRQGPINEAASLNEPELRASLAALCAALGLEMPMGQPSQSALDLSQVSLTAIAEQRDRDVAAIEAEIEAEIETERKRFEETIAAKKAQLAAKRIEASECRRAAERLERLTSGGGGSLGAARGAR